VYHPRTSVEEHLAPSWRGNSIVAGIRREHERALETEYLHV